MEDHRTDKTKPFLFESSSLYRGNGDISPVLSLMLSFNLIGTSSLICAFSVGYLVICASCLALELSGCQHHHGQPLHPGWWGRRGLRQFVAR